MRDMECGAVAMSVRRGWSRFGSRVTELCNYTISTSSAWCITAILLFTYLHLCWVSHIYMACMGTEWQIMMAIQDTKIFTNIVSGKSVM